MNLYINLFVIRLVGVMSCIVTKTKVARSLAKITARDALLKMTSLIKIIY